MEAHGVEHGTVKNLVDNPHLCPYCSKDNVVVGANGFNMEENWQLQYCKNPECKKRWRAFFSITDMEKHPLDYLDNFEAEQYPEDEELQDIAYKRMKSVQKAYELAYKGFTFDIDMATACLEAYQQNKDNPDILSDGGDVGFIEFLETIDYWERYRTVQYLLEDLYRERYEISELPEYIDWEVYRESFDKERDFIIEHNDRAYIIKTT